MSRILFSEKQKFSQLWLFAIIALTDLIVLAVLGNAFYTQLLMGEPWGDKPMSDLGLTIFLLLMGLVIVLVNIMIFRAKLEVEVKDNSLYYRYFPFVWNWKYIHKDNIKKYEIRQFNALREFGGYGYRKHFFKKRILTMAKKKPFVLRLDPEVLKAVEKWGADEFRSTNGQLEWIIHKALREVGRLKK